MKIIFGIGSLANDIVAKLDYKDIVCFLDNDKEKVGNLFFENQYAL